MTQAIYFYMFMILVQVMLPGLKLLSIDIECSIGMDLYSIAIFGKDLATVLMLDANH